MRNMTGMSGMVGNTTNGRPGNTTGFNNNPSGTANANPRSSRASNVTPAVLASFSMVAGAIALATL
jgi:hypothetical protein